MIIYPVMGTPVFTQGFGENPHIYKRFSLNGHNGIDFSLPIGSGVFAVDMGTIITVGYERDGFGRYVRISHFWGETLYGHLEEILVKSEDTILPHTLIAYSGNTGFSTGPHLHFGVKPYPVNRKNGYNGYIDPMPFFLNNPY